MDITSIQSSHFEELAECILHPYYFTQIFYRIINFLFPVTASQLFILTLLIFKSMSLFPFLMQTFLLMTFFLFYQPSKQTKSCQFDIWMYFLISILLPFSLYATSCFSLILTNTSQYIFHLLILITLPAAVFLGVLSFRYFSWMGIIFIFELNVEISVQRLQILKALFILLLLTTLFMAQFSFFHTSFANHILLFLSMICILFPMLTHYLNFTGYPSHMVFIVVKQLE